MSENERDSHFANFAEMEFRDLTPHLANYLHALNEDNVLEMHRLHPNAMLRNTPDMAEWPE